MALGFLAGIFGSVSTNLFGWLNRRTALKEKRLDIELEQIKYTHEVNLLELQAKAKQEETEQEAFLLDVQGSWDGMRASIADQTAATMGASRWVKNLLSLMRPSLTTALTVTTILLAFYLNDGNLRASVIASVVGLAEMSVTWWFGDRAIKRVIQASESR